MSYEPDKPVTQSQLRKYRNGAVAGFLILLFGIGLGSVVNNRDISDSAKDGRVAIVHSGRYVSVEGCNRDFHTTEQLRSLIVRGKASVARLEKSHDITHAQAQSSREQSDKALADLKLPDCRLVRDAITDNPKDIKTPPVAEYPGRKG